MSETQAATPQLPSRFHFGLIPWLLFRPRRAFERIAQAQTPTWLTPMLALTLTGLIYILVRGWLQTRAIMMGDVPLPADWQWWTPEMQAQYMQAQAATQGPVFQYVIPALGMLASLWLGWVIVGGLFHLTFTMLGGRGNTGSAMNLVAWAWLPVGVRDLLRVVYMLIVQRVIQSPGLSGFAPQGEAAFLGALLALVSKVSWLRRVVGEQCIECHRCARACPVGTIDPARNHASDPAECVMCLDCVPTCPRSSLHFVGHWRPGLWRAPVYPYDPSRRQLLASAGAAVAMVGLFGAEPVAEREHPRHLRPPGVRERELEGIDFLSQCIRCGVCLKVCPTSGLQPSLGEAGWAGLWTPVLVPRLGYCDFGCTACGQACPVGAIPLLSLEAKRQRVIGHATIDRNRCLPWADARNCLVCEEMCPVANKAIKLEEVETRAPDGETVLVKRPLVVRERCIGCGICEHHCPLSGEAAIRVVVATDVTALPPVSQAILSNQIVESL